MAGTRFCFVVHTTEEEDSTWTSHFREGGGATLAAVFFDYFFVLATFGSEGFFVFSRLYFSLFSSVFPFVFDLFLLSFPDSVLELDLRGHQKSVALRAALVRPSRLLRGCCCVREVSI